MRLFAFSWTRYHPTHRGTRPSSDHKFLEGDGLRFDREVMFDGSVYNLNGLTLENLRGYEECI